MRAIILPSQHLVTAPADVNSALLEAIIEIAGPFVDIWCLSLGAADAILGTVSSIAELTRAAVESAVPSLHSGLYLAGAKFAFLFPRNMAIFFALKFCLGISFLILVRGGTPRYRYDYLTKLGWLKFLGFVVAVFFASVTVYFLF